MVAAAGRPVGPTPPSAPAERLDIWVDSETDHDLAEADTETWRRGRFRATGTRNLLPSILERNGKAMAGSDARQTSLED
jgi:hypothetical protein